MTKLGRRRFIELSAAAMLAMLASRGEANELMTDHAGKDKTPPPVIRALSAEEKAALESGLNLAAQMANAPRPLGLAQVQKLYDRFLAEHISDEEAIIALGLAFGDDLAREGGFVWARVIDEYGEETSLAVPHRVMYANPISMIQKRIERQEKADLLDLRTMMLDAIAKQIPNSKRRD